MQRRLRFGILVLQNYPWPEIAEHVQRYEAFGLDSLWVADHFVDPWEPAGTWFECWMLLAALATQTRQIRLGPLVSHVVYRNPALLARQAMTVDHLSGGRLELGLGAGASEYDRSMTGVPSWPPAERVQRFHEAVEIVDRMLRAEVTTHHGRYYSVHDAAMGPGPLQRPRPPITIAASGPAMVRIAARYADTWNTEGNYPELWHGPATQADVLRITCERGELLSEAAAAHGRDPRAIARSFLAGFSPAPENAWASTDAFEDFVGRYREIGCTEFILPEPAANELRVFQRVAESIIPALQRTATE
jgi:alkanesulfonate monooxygenase SsuD/methylene tetrahydromethanopterin reductase-like flavin-dependent oxidoreductase (luciferase family)